MHHGTVHEYLGMMINYDEKVKMKFLMPNYINGIIQEAPEDMREMAVTPAASNLLTIRDNKDKLDDKRVEMYHHLTARLLYLCKRAHPDLQMTISFLMTWVTRPDKDDWKKLPMTQKDLFLTLETNDGITLKWWIDVSFAVLPNMKCHTDGTMSLGKGSVYSFS
jgi:hypothetical protein